MNRLAFYLVLAALMSSAPSSVTAASDSAQYATSRTPILVELFTSEGCSSCPPADMLLDKLENVQPVSGAELIVLSEHVDYWNHDGWKDPFSSSSYSDRQNFYKIRFGLNSVYTPEMVVDGTSELLGSDAHSAQRAVTEALKSTKIRVSLSSVSVSPANTLHAHVETDLLPASSRSKEANIVVAIVLHHAESDVLRGENAGHHLAYTNVVQTLKNMGNLRRGQTFSQDIDLKLPAGADTHNLQLVAFIQERNQGKILGATIQPVGN